MKALAGALVFLTVLTGQAHASFRADRATQIAAKAWQNPCVDRMRIRWADPFDGRASTAAWADTADCTIYFNRNRRLYWPEFCTRVLHEAGHLAEYRDPTNLEDPEHSSNPHDLMYHVDMHVYGFVRSHGRWRMSGGDWRCDDHGRAYLGIASHIVRKNGRVIGGGTI